jgi:hypothetical protein
MPVGSEVTDILDEKRLTNVILEDTLPNNVSYVESSYIDPVNEKLIEPTIVRNEDGTTKSLR